MGAAGKNIKKKHELRRRRKAVLDSLEGPPAAPVPAEPVDPAPLRAEVPILHERKEGNWWEANAKARTEVE